MQSWIQSKRFDLTFFILPGFLSVIFVALGNFYNIFKGEINFFWWLLLVVFIDVSHVWSTIFKTYFHKEASILLSKKLISIPLIGFIIMVFLYSIGKKVFWTFLAYLAVFHFVKQQVGLLKIYKRFDLKRFWNYDFDILFMYLLMIIPILYWHLTPRSFNWFIENDFISFQSIFILNLLKPILLISLIIFIAKELLLFKFNIPKILHILSTGLVWYFGIIYFNNDWSFTITNVIHHGIPYIALVWVNCLTSKYNTNFKFVELFFCEKLTYRFILIMLFLIFVALSEEILWDRLIWHEHFNFLHLEVSRYLEIFIVPLLALPQFTHYVLDGLIWKKNYKVSDFKF